MVEKIFPKPKTSYLINGIEVNRCIYLEMKESMRNFWGNMMIKYAGTMNALPKEFKIIEFKIVVDGVQKECVADNIFILMTRKDYENNK